MKAAVKDIVGKTVKGVIVKESKSESPRSQLFLIFSDDTYYEFYSESTIKGASGVDTGGANAARNYLSKNLTVFDYCVE